MNTSRLEASSPANWIERTIAQTSILLLPDATSSSQHFYLPKHPSLVKDAANRPAFSLTLILSRQLNATDETIYPLIQRGILSFEVALALPESAIAALQATGSAFLPLFARDATFRFRRDLTTLTTATATGANVKAALSVNLDRSTTLEVLAALDRTPPQGAGQVPPPATTEVNEAELRLTAEIAYRVAAADRTIHFSGSWASIHDFLRDRSPSGTFTLAEIESQFEQLLKLGLITVSEVNAPGKLQKLSTPSAELFSVFLRVATVILRRETPELESSDRANQYSLRSRPHPMFALDYRQKLTGTQMQTIALTTDLVTLFGGCLDQLDRAQFIHIVVPSSGGENGGFVPAPHRIRFARSRNERKPNTQLQLAALNGSVQSIALALKPDTTSEIAAHALINSDVIRPNQAQLNQQWFVDEVTVVDTKTSVGRSLPVVDNPNSLFWHDRIATSKCWYVPSFEVVQPATNQDLNSSPFLFSFERVGTSASQHLLSGTVRFQLRRGISSATQKALMQAGYPQAVAIPTNNLSVTLQLPFVDEKDNQLKRQSLLGQVEENGDLLTVTVSLANEWVRLCYGAIAYPNFQREPAFLTLSYSFLAYMWLAPEEVYLAYGGKTALTPVVYSLGETVDRSQAYFNAAEATYYTPSSKVSLQLEPRSLSAEIPVAVAERQLALHAASFNRPNSDLVLRPINPGGLKPDLTKPIQLIPAKPIVVLKPDVQQTTDLVKIIQQQRYAVQNQVRQERWQALFPCSTFGELYREKIGNSTTAIGCRDALQLGQVRLAQYEELPELAQEWFRVYRSLPQPGRFLVVPKRYRITRYAPNVPRAYRPVILAYYTIDLVNPANNRVTFHASLQPDVPPYARRELFARLLSFASKPVIEYPTELVSETEYAWTVDSRVQADLSAVKMPDCFQLALSVPPIQTPTLTAILQTSGIYGNVQFELPDGSRLQSALVMELSNVTGTWATGAIDVTISGNKATLTNKIESELVVSDLLVYGSGQRIPVEKNLKSGASLQVDLPIGVTEAYAVYAIQPGNTTAPEEIRRFAEDIKTNVIFASQINFANHELQRLDVQAQIEGLAGTHSVPLSGDPPVGQVELLLPLTTFLSRKVLQFCVTKTFTSGQTVTTNWINWDLETQGNFVSLQWNTIQ